ncbi:MAG: hypothetical protein QOE36_878, partial [Gaiellaceae bacterium]|nr:hypothetical protein [Gaiellaceae bacterium]
MTAVSPALRPPPHNPRFALIDSIRAIACVSVVVVHVAVIAPDPVGTWYGQMLEGLQAAVWVFFAVSGFLLYRPYVAALARGEEGPPLRDYLRRRVLRIVPAYWLALTALALWPGAPGVAGVFTGDWWRYYFFLQTYSDRLRPFGLSVAWSLCVEVTFYLALPFYARGIRRLSRAVGWKLAEIVPLFLLAGAGLTVRGLCAEGVLTWTWSPTLLGTTQFFAVGMGLAVASVAVGGREVRSRAWAFLLHRCEWMWLLAIGCLVLASSVFSYFVVHSYAPWLQVVGNDALGMTLALLLVLPAIFGAALGGLPRRILRLRALSWTGVVSYGIFLYHLPLVLWLMGTTYTTAYVPDDHSPLVRALPGFLTSHFVVSMLFATLALSFAAATVSYYVVELPLLRLKEWPLETLVRRLPRLDARRALDGAAAVFSAYGAVVFALFLVLALLVPYHFWDSLAFGEWSRLISAGGGFHHPSVSTSDLQRPLFYVLQGGLWGVIGFQEAAGRVLSLGFAALLAGSLALLASRRRHRRLESGVVLLLLVSSVPFAQQAFSGMSDLPAAALVAATGAALWLLPARPLRFALVAELAACAGLSKPTALVALGGLLLASLVGSRKELRANALSGALPIALGMLASLGYFVSQTSATPREDLAGVAVLGVLVVVAACLLRRRPRLAALPAGAAVALVAVYAATRGAGGLLQFLRAGTDGRYAELATAIRGSTAAGLEWLGPGYVLPLLLAFGLGYALCRAGGAGHRRAASIAAPVALALAWLGPWLASGRATASVGPLASGAHLLAWLLLAVPLLLARECPEELAPSRAGCTRLLLWCLPSLAVWLHETPYAPRLVAPAWPGLFLLLAAALVPGLVATARRSSLVLAGAVAALLLAALPTLASVDRLGPDGWSHLAALSPRQLLDREAVARAVSTQGLPETVDAVGRVAGARGRILTSDGELRFFFPG